jgi:hypothetical protein
MRLVRVLRLSARRFRPPALATAAIGFSLTFALVGMAVLAGWVPRHLVPGGVDTAVLLFLVPLVTLMFGIVVEVVRHELAQGTSLPATVPAWRAGVREG